MDLAFQQARAALEAEEVPVGCVFMRGDRVLSQAHNETTRTGNVGAISMSNTLGYTAL